MESQVCVKVLVNCSKQILLPKATILICQVTKEDLPQHLQTDRQTDGQKDRLSETETETVINVYKESSCSRHGSKYICAVYILRGLLFLIFFCDFFFPCLPHFGALTFCFLKLCCCSSSSRLSPFECENSATSRSLASHLSSLFSHAAAAAADRATSVAATMLPVSVSVCGKEEREGVCKVRH